MRSELMSFKTSKNEYFLFSFSIFFRYSDGRQIKKINYNKLDFLTPSFWDFLFYVLDHALFCIISHRRKVTISCPLIIWSSSAIPKTLPSSPPLACATRPAPSRSITRRSAQYSAGAWFTRRTLMKHLHLEWSTTCVTAAVAATGVSAGTLHLSQPSPPFPLPFAHIWDGERDTRCSTVNGGKYVA